jgi:hypothetical protein
MPPTFSPKRPSSGPAKASASDYPLAAHQRALRAFDEYDACVTEYRVLLDVQRSLLASDNVDGILQMSAKGDVIARRVAHCGRRISPVQETLVKETYSGPRTAELRRRLASAQAKVEQVVDVVAQVSVLCMAKRDFASTQLSQEQRAAQTLKHRVAYAAPTRSSNAFDIRR